jgi:ribosomal protein L20A (L18A)
MTMAALKAFRIEGTFPMGVNKHQNFAREVVCKDEIEAKENVFSLLGSEHAVRRRFIKIKAVRELKTEEITSLRVKRALGVK